MNQITEESKQEENTMLEVSQKFQIETSTFITSDKEGVVVLKNEQSIVTADNKDTVKEKVITLKILRRTDPIRYQLDDIMNKPIGTLEINLSEMKHNTNFIKKGKEIHGDNIIYSHIDPNIVLHNDTLFELQCFICLFRWWTTKGLFINSKGCAWCNSQCLRTTKNSLYIVVFVGSRIHNNIYDYSFNDPKTTISGDSILKIWCRKDTHKYFEERVAKHLSRGKTGNQKTSGCPECNEEIKKLLPKKIRKDWHNNLELLKSEGIRVHGNIYDYSLNSAKDIVTCMSEIKIKCLQIKKNGHPCLRVFEQKIHNHIDLKNGCRDCGGTLHYNYQIFMQRFNERYPYKPFLLHHIKEDDVVDVHSKLTLECSKFGCEYIFTCSVNDLLNNYIRQCSRCNNREPWTPERLEKACIKSEAEGLYSYSLVKFSEIENCNSLLSIICNRCVCKGYKNFIFEQTINHHFADNHSGCLRCSGHMPWTPERTKEECELKEKFGQYSYENTNFLNIKGKDSLLLITCIYCKKEGFEEYIFSQTISSHFTQCSGCSRCGGTLKWTKKRFLVDSKRKEKEGRFSYENVDLDSIDNCNTIIPISCIICRNNGNRLYIFLQSINAHFNYHRGCLRCNNSLPWTEQKCIDEVKENNLEERYSYNFSEFVHVKNADSIINIDCLVCKNDGYEKITFSQTVKEHFTDNKGCSRCGGVLKWNYDKFLEELPRLPKSFTVFFDYSAIKPNMIENGKSLLPITCLICNNPFRRTVAGHILRQQGCTYCKKSKGEKFIYNYLKINNIEFDDQVHVLGYNGNYFRYDFEIKYMGKTMIIEYDGKQHFHVVSCWNTEEMFNESRKRDIYKQNMALKEGKKVIRIDYTINFNDMEKYLNMALKHPENIYYSSPSLYEWME